MLKYTFLIKITKILYILSRGEISVFFPEIEESEDDIEDYIRHTE